MIHPMTDEDSEAKMPYTFRQHAAVRFALQGLSDTNRLQALTRLLPDGSAIGGVAGDPGWILERRDPGDPMPGYADWPGGASFRAFVDPEVFILTHPERYYRRDEFLAYVRVAVAAYLACRPDRADTLAELRAMIDMPPDERMPSHGT